MIKVHRPVAAQFKISSPYGIRKDPVTGKEGTFHFGTDFATPIGTPVVAALKCKIYKTGFQDEQDKTKGFGRRVWTTTKEDKQEISIFYGHLSEISVQAGEEVEAGTRIGLSGNTGKSSNPHLHFECRIDGGRGVEVQFV